MFVQVIEGHVKGNMDAHRAMERWMSDLSQDAIGWLGTTAGTTDDGRFIALARFADEESARRNSERPEQGAWWSETAEVFTDEPTFRDTTDVDVMSIGDPDAAGFVQVIQGHSTDPSKVRELMNGHQDELAAHRPEILCNLSLGHDDGDYTAVIYFTSEDAAREGERKEVPESVKADMDAVMQLDDREPTFLDLRDPWLYSPA